MNSEGKVYVQKRAEGRRLFPNKWENPGGGALAGQNSKETFEREFKEEMGISPNLDNSQMILTIKREKDFVDMWFVKQDFDISDLTLQDEEVSSAKWVSFKELDEMIKNGEFCPTIEQSLIPFKNWLKKNY